uniref:DNA-directed RNA polymerase subunit n=1 Tax=Peromyscus maniculatus bairdii TaxID=230844 RepID=A0A8C8UCX1_PERMB
SFVVALRDTLPPWQFEWKLNDSIAKELNKKLANKFVYNVRLCICLFDITKLEDAYVFPEDRAPHTKVYFQYSLQQPAKFDETEQVWVWEYETEEGACDLYMDTGEEICFRAVDESFVDTSLRGPSSAEAASASKELPKKEALYSLVGSISEPGLRVGWWLSLFP